MKNILITHAAKPNKQFISALIEAGWSIDYHEHETATVATPSKYDCVVCNGLFLHNPIDRFSNLRTIQLTSAGLDRVPVDYVTRHGISLFNARGVYSIPMAEWAIGAILDIYRNFSDFHKSQTRHEWVKKREIRELYGKSVAIVGAGSVGSEVAKRIKSFGTSVIGYDIKPYLNESFDNIHKIADFQPIEYDIIILTVPLTDYTKHMIDGSMILQMKENAILINMSRGGVIDENTIIHALKKRMDLTLCLDVFEIEPLPSDSMLWDCPNVIVYPHNSFVGEGNEDRLHSVILNNLCNI